MSTQRAAGNVQIRSARTSDITQLHRLYSDQYPDAIKNKHKSIAKYIRKALKTDLKQIAKHYLDPPRHALWVAVDAKDETIIIGMLAIRANKSCKMKQRTAQSASIQMLDELITTFSGAHVWADAELMRFGVLQSYRRKGVGSALLEHAKRFCCDKGYGCITASTMNVLEDAIRFYEASGFTLQRTEPCGPRSSSLKFLRFVLGLILVCTNVANAQCNLQLII